ncbi:hypothetical protein E3O44_06810 [Cryobacterium algoricola]|uniref:Competence protein CoiA nuclease-like domain-containing protein n=1 Tax=Cryobacterium algoricola TaxID=1259183 RepID=A0ABY2IBB8_9MICO|nr:hypothetical protein [Cryobacterium algoricola]TFB86872.1 hypothetical protein E3O44_06810 [Cryobacterium algoricola]
MVHGRKVLREFLAGEVRLIYARVLANGKLYLLPDGDAAAQRAWTKTEACCPIPGCENPALTTVARKRGRDGFRHTGGGAGSHSAVGVFHVQASEMISQYLQKKYPSSTVTKEQPIDRARTRIADVMITASTGESFAFEIQYAGLRADEWEARHASYASESIPEVWLFGHAGAQLRPARGRANEGLVTISPVHSMAGVGQTILWLNPLTEQIATVIERVTVKHVMYSIPATGPTGELLIMPLTDFRLASRRNGTFHFTSDRVEELIANGRAVRKIWAHEAAILAHQVAAEQARLQAAATSQEAARRVAAAKQLAMATAATKQEPAWAASELRTHLFERFSGTWPAWLDVEIPPGLPVPNAQWQAMLYSAMIMDVKERRTVTAAAGERLLGLGANFDAQSIIRQWFDVLVENQILMTMVNRPPESDSGVPRYVVVDEAARSYWTEASQYRYTKPDIGAGICMVCEGPLRSQPDVWRGTHGHCF